MQIQKTVLQNIYCYQFSPIINHRPMQSELPTPTKTTQTLNAADLIEEFFMAENSARSQVPSYFL